MFKKIPEETYFPTVWFETKVTVPPTMAAEVLLLSKMPLMLAVTGMALLGIGIGVTAVVAVCYANKNSGGSNTDDLSDQSPILNQSLFNESQQQQQDEQHHNDDDD